MIKVFTFILVSVLVFQDGDWKLERDKNEIQVFTRKMEESGLKESRVVGYLPASPDDVADILMDFTAYKTWIPTCIESETLKEVNPGEFYYYSEYKAPWPVANRDLVVHATIERSDDGIIFIYMKGVPGYIEEKRKKVRIPDFEGFWKLQPVENGKTYATNQFYTDPGGGVPSWLANTASVDNPFKTFSELKERLSGE